MRVPDGIVKRYTASGIAMVLRLAKARKTPGSFVLTCVWSDRTTPANISLGNSPPSFLPTFTRPLSLHHVSDDIICAAGTNTLPQAAIQAIDAVAGAHGDPAYVWWQQERALRV
jgi:hypothetical protein